MCRRDTEFLRPLVGTLTCPIARYIPLPQKALSRPEGLGGSGNGKKQPPITGNIALFRRIRDGDVILAKCRRWSCRKWCIQSRPSCSRTESSLSHSVRSSIARNRCPRCYTGHSLDRYMLLPQEALSASEGLWRQPQRRAAVGHPQAVVFCSSRTCQRER